MWYTNCLTNKGNSFYGNNFRRHKSVRLYKSKKHFDELISQEGRARKGVGNIARWLRSKDAEELSTASDLAQLAIRQMGISFTVYSEETNIDREWPFDIIPRTISANDWKTVSRGLAQRLRALNRFIDDIYNRQKILAEDVVPAELVLTSPNFRAECVGMKPAQSAWANVCGTDLVRDNAGHFFVLEDNLRVPSGVSYMIENREVTKRVLPELFYDHSILPVDDYPSRLFEMLASLAPGERKKPNIVVLTPGIYNSAYFEHAYLAREMGVELVEGGDLIVSEDNYVQMNTVDGPVRVDVIYRRINEEYLDPEVFEKDSLLGVAGLMRAWKSGNVSIANSPGSGVADDKAIYAFVPTIIRYYLKQEPILHNVRTYLCRDPRHLEFVLKNIRKLVVKPVNESGGYGILVGPHSTDLERNKYVKQLEKNPENYVAQPTLALSTAPTVIEGNIEPRHLDLRPFILQGKKIWATNGGLTRVALKKGSLVVNSSQGGGSKDTWIVEKVK
mgnify:CR=1 FL=1